MCAHEEFERQARRAPGAIAVALGNETLTYADLNARANHLAHRLIARSVGPEILVGMCLERTPDLIVAILGILKAGGAYVPLDLAYPQARLDYILRDTNLRLIVTQRHLGERLPAFDGETVYLDSGIEVSDPPPRAAPENLAYLIYTSGSTGNPKGVMIEHRNLTALFRATEQHFDFSPRDVWTLFHSCAFDFSVWEIWGALLYGGRLEIVPRDIARSGPEFAEFLAERCVTVLNQTPSAFTALIRVPGMDNRNGDLALRLVIFGGEALNPAKLKPWADSYCGAPPDLVNMYGITETTIHTTYHRLTSADLNSPRSVIGRPLPHLGIRLAEDGEILVAGVGVARGYLNRPDLTKKRFRADANGIHEYRSGDLGRLLPDGCFEHLGRKDQQAKIRGYRIELGEIETALNACEGVAECIVVALENDAASKRLVAYAVPVRDRALDRLRINATLSARLPDHMLPTAIVALDALPLTTNGKIDRTALPCPRPEDSMRQPYVAPRTVAEKTLAEIWGQLLKVDRVGAADNFFALGGDSLLATEMAVRLGNALGIQISLARFFEMPVLADFAEAISQTSFPQKRESKTVTEAGFPLSRE